MSEQTTFTVTGMTCGNCVKHVTEELTEIDGVTDVAVDLVAGGDVVGDGDAGRERLVVGVGVDEEQPRGAASHQDRFGAGHRDTPTTPSSGTPP